MRLVITSLRPTDSMQAFGSSCRLTEQTLSQDFGLTFNVVMSDMSYLVVVKCIAECMPSASSH